MKKFILCCLLCGAAQFVFAQKTIINVDLNKEVGEMHPFWAWFGADEPNYAYMRDGKKLLSELSAMSPVPVYFRAHNLLTSGHDTMNLKSDGINHDRQ